MEQHLPHYRKNRRPLFGVWPKAYPNGQMPLWWDQPWTSRFVRGFRRLFAEFIGSAILTFIHAGGRVSQATGTVDNTGVGLADGLALVVLVYALGQVGGGHFNPCITLALALRRATPFSWVIPYWIAQFAGAQIAGLFLWALFPDKPANLGATAPAIIGNVNAMFMEACTTFILTLTVLSLAQRGSVVGAHAAIAIGAAIAMLVIFSGPFTGGSMNPARSFGTMSITGLLDVYWVYVAGPLIGCLVATGAAYVLASHSKLPGEKAFARGWGDATGENQRLFPDLLTEDDYYRPDRSPGVVYREPPASEQTQSGWRPQATVHIVG
eukprot:GILJ01018331.1.p1 GENE.GILJ01018331.1~~GILJ01018331.1.p1  ORF type:complete len:324 (+),score=16.53 GILJ01018331.1:107-1078(+)